MLLIRRIKDGLEIPGLKEALIKILQDFNLQISLLEGCQTILHTDVSTFSSSLFHSQTHGHLGSPQSTTCLICSLPAFAAPHSPPLPSSKPDVTLVYLCRHIVHASCAMRSGPSRKGAQAEDEDELELPPREEWFRSDLLSADRQGKRRSGGRTAGAKMAYAQTLRVKLPRGCPHCRQQSAANKATSWSSS